MSNHVNNGNKYVSLLQEFSVPLLAGVVVALLVANVNPERYDRIVHGTWTFFTGDKYHGHGHNAGHREHEHSHQDKSSSHDGHDEPLSHNKRAEVSSLDDHHESDDWWHHYASMHFIINDIFMVFFFGVAAKEITEACLPGGALNPPSKAINPLLGTIGGVLGPVGAYFLFNAVMGVPGWEVGQWSNGWGIPTATDIALAWLIARLVFGNGHPAIAFLLLLAVADDGIGLVIIAIFYPSKDPVWLNLLWILPGMLVAYGFRKMNLRWWWPYIFIGGGLSWWGLYSAHLHPALALVPIVPLLPGPKTG